MVCFQSFGCCSTKGSSHLDSQRREIHLRDDCVPDPRRLWNTAASADWILDDRNPRENSSDLQSVDIFNKFCGSVPENWFSFKLKVTKDISPKLSRVPFSLFVSSQSPVNRSPKISFGMEPTSFNTSFYPISWPEGYFLHLWKARHTYLSNGSTLAQARIAWWERPIRWGYFYRTDGASPNRTMSVIRT